VAAADETSVTAGLHVIGDVQLVSQDFDPAAVTDLDIRELLARGVEPLATILARADALDAGGVLHVRSPFQPTPLYHVMTERGYRWRNARFADDDWSSWFWRAEAPPLPAREPEATDAVPDGVVDLRRLSPPEPLLWILQWSSQAHRGDELRVMLPAFPEPLASLLPADAWQLAKEAERPDGVVVRIERR
jgi:uncharacterized protein (DUF2249 family)